MRDAIRKQHAHFTKKPATRTAGQDSRELSVTEIVPGIYSDFEKTSLMPRPIRMAPVIRSNQVDIRLNTDFTASAERMVASRENQVSAIRVISRPYTERA